MRPPTRFLLATVFVLASSPWLHANSVPLTSGRIVLPDSTTMSTAEFRGAHALLSQVASGDFALTFGVHSCWPCTMADIRNLRIPLAVMPPDGSLFTGGNQFGWLDGAAFKAVTFHSSLSPSGELTVWGRASAQGDFRTCSYAFSQEACYPNGTVFALADHGQWRYRIRYRPARGLPGYFEFADMTLHTVPEPATVALMGSGLGVLGIARRKRQKS